MTTTAPHGSWTSPVTVDQLTSASVGLAEVLVDGEDLYWLEAHPEQAGRCSVWRAPLAGGEAVEVTPPTANVRSRVHEYGGGAYGVRDGVLVYSEMADGRLYRVDEPGTARALTPAGDLRFGDVRVHPARGLVLAVREDHRGPGEAVGTVVAVALEPADDEAALEPGTVLVDGADFYSTPELADDDRLAWVSWDHPAMPWDATTLAVGTLTGDGPAGWRVTDVRRVAGGPAVSAVQPRWTPGGTLVFVDDRSGWWNLYAWSAEDGTDRPLHATEAEFCEPGWVLGMNPYVVVDDGWLVCALNRSGLQSVALLSTATGELTRLTADGTEATELAVGGGRLAAVLRHPDRPAALAVTSLPAAGGTASWDDRRRSSSLELPAAAVARAEPVSWASELGEVHGFYYPPTSAEFAAPEGSLPPLITLSHGGPTSFSSPAFSLSCQFWTSRGYAVLDVNYGGSTGYGRAYRERLVGRWGLVDVADCAAGAQAMGDQGRADPARLVVKGGSAGGYTTLRALTATRVFAAGISQYGIGSLEALALDTHKFESRYLDGLVGPYPEARDVYVERSPMTHVDSLAAPILLLQGTEDKVVPPAQAEEMADAARRKGLPVALIMFEGEGHGFRRAENIRRSLEAQQYFLGRLFGFTPADDVQPVEIENLD
ncbi:Dipeptidyl aminopeptidase/acylaminoacyl peptidase [Friedmanniella luteola]|uniref:Dipeptidyl aminopeptidase/acylaminoacyl peptidase n=1 Tax=Friedmanniella luteola TaxID=546871 RepID=A0A1H1W656_9ACTN|nr:prolyl oligopeptidase family serine peptidase [Friedmanniella luteola]SDS92200.1 Dipeptidyl aminopeptidase/acylaminoacyl peptidase [Friedmanniella luteola]